MLSNENVLNLDGDGADMGPYICQNSKLPTSNGFILMHVTYTSIILILSNQKRSYKLD